MPNSSIYIVGNLAGDPELRFTPQGQAVARMRVAVSERYYDTGEKEWKDRDPNWYVVNCWRNLAENVSETFKRGDRVICIGDMKQRSYEKDDETRYVWELEARAVGAELTFVSARLQKADRNSGEDEVAQKRASKSSPSRQPAASNSRSTSRRKPANSKEYPDDENVPY